MVFLQNLEIGLMCNPVKCNVFYFILTNIRQKNSCNKTCRREDIILSFIILLEIIYCVLTFTDPHITTELKRAKYSHRKHCIRIFSKYLTVCNKIVQMIRLYKIFNISTTNKYNCINMDIF